MTEGAASGRNRAADSSAAVAAPSGRRPLGRELILREAVRFIDQRGQDRLTMRQLGAELNVEAMALYRYVPGRELLDGVVEYVMNELYETTMTGERATTWEEYLQQMAHGVRNVISPTRGSSRWWQSVRRPRRGSGRRCGASAGSRVSSRRLRHTASRRRKA